MLTAASSAGPLSCTVESFTADVTALANSLHLALLWLVLCNITTCFIFTINLDDFFRQIWTCSLIIHESCGLIRASEHSSVIILAYLG